MRGSRPQFSIGGYYEGQRRCQSSSADSACGGAGPRHPDWNYSADAPVAGGNRRSLGLSVVAVSVLLVIAAVHELRRKKTAFDVRKPTSAIVRTGVFRLIRNPVYLSMMLLYVGLSLLINSPWMLLLAIPTGSALCLAAIKPEERYLEAKFGDVYREYRTAVPRWIGLRSITGNPTAR